MALQIGGIFVRQLLDTFQRVVGTHSAHFCDSRPGLVFLAEEDIRRGQTRVEKEKIGIVLAPLLPTSEGLLILTGMKIGLA
jgi:hypothetical protein